MEMRQVSPFGLLRGAAAVALAGIALVCATATPAVAATPGADCQPYASRPCLLPFPDNRLTKTDSASVTGLRVNLPAAAMPVNTKGVRVSTAAYDGNDGFSPGSSIVVHIPGLDNAAALKRTGAVPLTDISRSLAKRQPIVLIDQATGKRQLIWAELDSNAKTEADTDLLIHSAEGLAEGHTFIVALRDLRTAAGKLIAAPKWFARLRDGNALPAAERSQRGRYQKIFAALTRAKVATDSSLYEAWSFTVASRQGLTGRMLAIRNNAFAQLGDTDLADSVVQGRAPAFTVTAAQPETDVAGASLTEVEGTFQVPCYLVVCGASAQPGFHYGSSGLYATPTQLAGNVATTNFDCIVPATATASNPARISLYGHGLLGSAASEVTAGNVEAMATEHNMVFCGTDFWGLAQPDTINDAGFELAVPGPIAAQPGGSGFQPGVPPGRGCAGHRDLEPVLRRQQPGWDHGRLFDRAGPGLASRRARGDRHRLRHPPGVAQHRLCAVRADTVPELLGHVAVAGDS
jgi:hypothetical protein